jgi:hypothetical protein
MVSLYNANNPHKKMNGNVDHNENLGFTGFTRKKE